MDRFRIRAFGPADEAPATQLLDAYLGGRRQVRLGEMHDVLALPGFVAEDGDRIVGVATYALEGRRAELAVLLVTGEHRRLGVASSLISAVVTAVVDLGGDELWLVTTNDNLDALRFYQRRDFRLHELRPGAVDRSRKVKPEIPLVGQHAIPLRDELVLVRPLREPLSAGPRTEA
ncbi:MAG: GNAT family N-acetyltransferase [Actinomycetota bacterium]|nr:GNAT family N-acetyltransferase [Actinomycetota bacterium]